MKHMDIDERCVVCRIDTGLACPDCEGITPLCANCKCPQDHAGMTAAAADIAALREALRGCLPYVDMWRNRTCGEGDIAAMNARAALARTERGDK